MKIPNILGSPKAQRTIMGKSKSYMNNVINKTKINNKNNKNINQTVKDRNQEYNAAKAKNNAATAKGHKIDTKA